MCSEALSVLVFVLFHDVYFIGQSYHVFVMVFNILKGKKPQILP